MSARSVPNDGDAEDTRVWVGELTSVVSSDGTTSLKPRHMVTWGQLKAVHMQVNGAITDRRLDAQPQPLLCSALFTHMWLMSYLCGAV